MDVIIQHYRKGPGEEWWEALYLVKPRGDGADGVAVYRKIPDSEKPCECLGKKKG